MEVNKRRAPQYGVLAFHQHNINLVKHSKKIYASTGNRTLIYHLEGSYAVHYTTTKFLVEEGGFFIRYADKVTELVLKGTQFMCASIAQWQSISLVNQRT